MPPYSQNIVQEEFQTAGMPQESYDLTPESSSETLKTLGSDEQDPDSKLKKPRPSKCKLCNFEGSSKLEFYTHLRGKHAESGKLLCCTECIFATFYKHHLDYHLKNHNGLRPFMCSECEYRCVNKAMLISHRKSHQNIYEFSCANCTYATKYKHSLKTHLRKYGHNPGPVLNADGTPNTNAIIDVNGKRRGPSSRKKLRKAKSSSNSNVNSSANGQSKQAPQMLSFYPRPPFAPINPSAIYGSPFNNFPRDLMLRPPMLQPSPFTTYMPRIVPTEVSTYIPDVPSAFSRMSPIYSPNNLNPCMPNGHPSFSQLSPVQNTVSSGGQLFPFHDRQPPFVDREQAYQELFEHHIDDHDAKDESDTDDDIDVGDAELQSPESSLETDAEVSPNTSRSPLNLCHQLSPQNTSDHSFQMEEENETPMDLTRNANDQFTIQNGESQEEAKVGSSRNDPLDLSCRSPPISTSTPLDLSFKLLPLSSKKIELYQNQDIELNKYQHNPDHVSRRKGKAYRIDQYLECDDENF